MGGSTACDGQREQGFKKSPSPSLPENKSLFFFALYPILSPSNFGSFKKSITFAHLLAVSVSIRESIIYM